MQIKKFSGIFNNCLTIYKGSTRTNLIRHSSQLSHCGGYPLSSIPNRPHLLTKAINTLSVRLPSLHRGQSVMASNQAPHLTGTKICKVGVVQMTSTPDKEATYSQAEDLVVRARNSGADVVFLPEACDYIGDSQENALKAAEYIDGSILQNYKQLAIKQNVWLSLGGLHIKTKDGSDTQISNTHVMLNSDGQIVGQYRKTHLFDVNIPGKVRLQETDFTQPGEAIGPPISTPAGKVGLAICYDLRFAELSLGLTNQGADILTYPSAFTIPTGKAHWEVLLRARAIENQCYVVAAAQVGKHHEKRSSYGHAMIIDPWGVVLADLGTDIGVTVIEIDLDMLHKRRQEMPVQKHRRHDLYGVINISARPNIDSCKEYQFGQVTVPSSCVFYATPLSYAFVNKKPVVPGHVLVSPMRAVQRYDELTPAEVMDISLTTQTVSRAVQQHYNCTSRTIAIQDGPEAGQTILHVHYHILPRKSGDFKRNDEIYDKLETHDTNVEPSAWRSLEDMTRQAKELRSLFPYA